MDIRQMLPQELCKNKAVNPCSPTFMSSIKETLHPLGTGPHLGPVTQPQVSAILV